MSHSLVELLTETIGVLETLSRALDGEDVDPEQEKETEKRVNALMQKFRSFGSTISNQGAKESSLRRLNRLIHEVEEKNKTLDSFRLGLKEFELEMSLRSGSIRKDQVQIHESKLHSDIHTKRFRLDGSLEDL